MMKSHEKIDFGIPTNKEDITVTADSPVTPPNNVGDPVVRPEGVTASERYLGRLCENSFLSLWSYPNGVRDQGRKDGKGDGKELCDVLVIFENHIIVFSDKDIAFDNSCDIQADWARWYRRAVVKSAKQVYGAERWIRNFPERLFLDRRCTVPFPLVLPGPSKAQFHRIVVAHDASRQCRERLGGSGSLMIDNSVIGDAHLKQPFRIGHIDPTKGYVHVFDDTTLDIVMKTLDTVSDFTAYLTKKELFLTDKKAVLAAGDEELLAVYLGRMNDSGEHDFAIKGNYDRLIFPEGFWEEFTRSPERQAQINYDEISYAWDKLIETFAFHAMTGTQYLPTGTPLCEQEKAFRFLAREPRTRRRLLANSLHEVLERSIHSRSPWDARVILPSRIGDPFYVFLFLKRRPGMSDEEYRMARFQLLSDYCHVTKLEHPDAVAVIGIATEAGLESRRSEDLCYLDASHWNN